MFPLKSKNFFFKMLTKSLKDTCKTYVDFVFNTPANIHVLRVNNRSTRPRYGICSKLTIKTPERRYWCRFSVFIVNYGHILHLVFLLLTVNMLLPAGYCVLVRLCSSMVSLVSLRCETKLQAVFIIRTVIHLTY